MILDNKNKNLKVHEWIVKYTKEGKFSLVTGYFTIGALAYLSDKINEKIKAFNFVLGDIVHTKNVRRKNRLLIAATLEELSSEGKQSAILETLCEKLLGFAKKP